jgi:predicted CopG family antitoxin
MSTKTIALEVTVYDRLAANKHPGESFSKAIDRLLTDTAAANTGSDILGRLESFAALPEEEAQVFLDVIAEDRAAGGWEAE